MKDIGGRLAIVSGAGSGIGRSIALALAGRGARLLLVDLAADRLSGVAAQARETGASVSVLACDAADADFGEKLFGASAALGPVDILVNNVGVLSGGYPQDIPPDEWARVLNVNLLSMVRTIHCFLPGMLERRHGHIVNTASFSGLFPYAFDRLPYAASKSAIIAMSEGLALYLRPQGVDVTCLCPGPVRTSIGETARTFSEGLARRPPPFPLMEPDDVGRQVLDAIEKRRFFLPTDLGVRPYMMDRAADPDAFLDRQIAMLAGNDSISPGKAP